MARYSMTYEGVKDRLKSIVEWLEGTNTTDWKGQADLTREFITALEEMLTPIPRRDIAGSDEEEFAENPDTENLQTAKHHAMAMRRAILTKNRATALKSGKAALAALTNI